ncbi:sigma-70 family RNA polymerase sigma factor [Arthrobacter burdickii]|uniref:Sigma-70 family RNA polymerase sigma factor n=1 Tax=Arthrobacter burdickii TaxID=3035920 RepID=A0ABT8K5S4_9MICC|nr:sigma-70 family RNA polymerase sigma factor [Arthrobacter burdickii]MDN4611882.1 sigma-70 family RNA polymerase sigma factor [Arthrobacter burdickii]
MHEQTAIFEGERPRLLRLAERIISDHAEAEDIVQQAWLRLSSAEQIDHVPAWLTTVTTRLCLDRLRAKTPVPQDELEDDDPAETYPDPADEVALADTVGLALQVVLERLTPRERVAFVLHESFDIDFATIATILDASPDSARKLASRARAKVARPSPVRMPDWQVVDAFLAAARGGDFSRLLELLAPDVIVTGDDAAVALGTPQRMAGRQQVASFFNGAAKTAFAVFLGSRPGAAWIHRGEAKVVFDFTVVGGRVSGITFRAAPEALASVQRREADGPAQSSDS